MIRHGAKSETHLLVSTDGENAVRNGEDACKRDRSVGFPVGGTRPPAAWLGRSA